MNRLEGKTALITGATSGIGLASAKAFLAAGARVAISGRNQQTLDRLNEEFNGEVLTLRADAAKLSDNAPLFSAVQERFGKLDILFLNAGIARFAPVAQTSEEVFDEITNINLKGPFFTIQAALPYLNDGASVIATTTIANEKGMPMLGAYAASKAGLRSLVQVAAAELAERNIRVNAVSPGPVETPLFGKVGLTQEQMDEFGANVSQKVLLRRFGQSEEVAKAALFLASDEASFITGEELVVDGGISIA